MPYGGDWCLLVSPLDAVTVRQDVQAALQEVLHQKDNRVWVGIRVRDHSTDAGSFAVDRRRISLANPSSSTASASSTSFVFNRVFDHRANQMDVWSSIQAPLMRCVLRREHACLFAYGQTGSGKTYTMFGDPASLSESGLAFRILTHRTHGLPTVSVSRYYFTFRLLLCFTSQGITDSLKQLLQSTTCTEDRPLLEFSFLEVYNERVHAFRLPKILGLSKPLVQDCCRVVPRTFSPIRKCACWLASLAVKQLS